MMFQKYNQPIHYLKKKHIKKPDSKKKRGILKCFHDKKPFQFQSKSFIMKKPKCHQTKYIERIKKNNKNFLVHYLQIAGDLFGTFSHIKQEDLPNIIPGLF